MHVLTIWGFSQVKGGGHASNPGFSSTEGVQIAMYRFSEVKYNPDNQTAEVGSGLIWDEVYTALEPYAVNVVGGRVTGVGMAGFTLGGGEYYASHVFSLHHIWGLSCACGSAGTAVGAGERGGAEGNGSGR